jgi:CubicO group peptidase (beta-lactamase class C family)
MLRLFLALTFSCTFLSLQAQNDYYFPPITGDNWETVDPAELGWCTDQIDTLLQFLGEKNSKGFIVLHKGMIAIEQYYDSFTQDSLWYWASAGKTLTAFLTGVAQEEGWLSIEDPTNDYLGDGWTNAPPEKEDLITVWHQLTMTTGLDDGVADVDCTTPDCLQYLTDAGTRWAYHNGPYTLTQSVIEQATGQTINQFTFSRLNSKTGMSGIWLPLGFISTHVSKPRDMARFGSLMLNDGVWDGETVLADQDYLEAMRTPSQSINEAYGYLWWLNGQDTYQLPQTQITFNGSIIPAAPADLYAGLGKNDQKLYIVPSLDLVVVRMGDAAGGVPLLSLSSFDNQLWEKLMAVIDCTPNRQQEVDAERFLVYPNPANDVLQFSGLTSGENRIIVIDRFGRTCWEGEASQELSIRHLEPGWYVIQVVDPQGKIRQTRFLKQ